MGLYHSVSATAYIEVSKDHFDDVNEINYETDEEFCFFNHNNGEDIFYLVYNRKDNSIDISCDRSMAEDGVYEINGEMIENIKSEFAIRLESNERLSDYLKENKISMYPKFAILSKWS